MSDSNRSPAAPRPPLPGPLGRLAERAYLAALARRNQRFDAGAGVLHLPIPVISVGNLTVGGTGKTPMVQRIAQWLLDANLRPAIAMRGYRSTPDHPSDEHSEHLACFAGALPIIAQPDRAAGLRPLIASGAIDCAVLDDGFQHRQLARDLDAVLIDATQPLHAARCLPAGWLREPPSALARAHAVVLTRTSDAPPEALDALRSAVSAHAGSPPIAECAHAWDSLDSADAHRPIEWLASRRVIVACAVGNPGAFVRAAQRAGALVEATLLRRDHHAWNNADRRALERLTNNSLPVLTTMKDWVKWRRLNLGPLEHLFVRPRLTLQFSHGEDALRSRVLATARATPTPRAGVH